MSKQSTWPSWIASTMDKAWWRGKQADAASACVRIMACCVKFVETRSCLLISSNRLGCSYSGFFASHQLILDTTASKRGIHCCMPQLMDMGAELA